MSQLIDLSNPKEAALVDLLALAIAADGRVGAEEILFASDRLKSLLGIADAEVDEKELVAELGGKVRASILRLKDEGTDVYLQNAVMAFETAEEREMAFALCSALVCVDGELAPDEAEFLCQLRHHLGMSEAQVLCGVVALATHMAKEGISGRKA